jgi:hypothetical protein
MAGEQIDLLVGLDASELRRDDGVQRFAEGPTSSEARLRLARIREKLSDGWLAEMIEKSREQDSLPDKVNVEDVSLLRLIVDSITSEVGRAIVGLCVLQLTIKAIEPTQSIRLHKGSPRSGTFSWVEGIPMRVLDKEFNTPVLRRTGLLNLNSDGVFMTRTLAENYPYSPVYKAAIRGAKNEWLALVESIESDEFDAENTLLALLGMLWNRTQVFEQLSDECLKESLRAVEVFESRERIQDFIIKFVSNSKHSARLFEIALHSFFQVLNEDGAFAPNVLKPLSQMRSANKKHGNVGDVEIVEGLTDESEDMQVIEAWDAKFNKSDLTDEIAEISDKIQEHPELQRVGFVLSVDRSDVVGISPTRRNPIEVEILQFDEFIRNYESRTALSPVEASKRWLVAFVETLCQRRRHIAPVDEPTIGWVGELLVKLQEIH